MERPDSELDGQSDDDTDNPRCVADEYIAQHFLPNTDLPIELPNEIRDVLTNANVDTSSVDEIWYALRSGTGELLLPGMGWRRDAEFLFDYLHGEDGHPESGPNTESRTNVVHIFRNLQAGIHLTQTYRSDTVVDLLYDPELLKERLRNYIDLTPLVLEEYQRILVRVDKIEDSNATYQQERTAAYNELWDFLISLEDTPLGIEQAIEVIVLAKKWELAAGFPLYCVLAEHWRTLSNLFSGISGDFLATYGNLSQLDLQIYYDLCRTIGDDSFTKRSLKSAQSERLTDYKSMTNGLVPR